MTPEVFPNLAIGFLNGLLSSAAVTASLRSGFTLPTVGNYMAKIDSELIQVTGISGSTATIARGQEGSTAASHVDGSTMFALITQGSLGRLCGQMHNGTLATQRPNLNFVDADGRQWSLADDPSNNACDLSVGNPNIVTPPKAASWTWENQDTSSSVDLPAGGVSLLSKPNGAECNCLVQTIGSPPYTITAALLTGRGIVSFARNGIILYNSTSGKAVSWGWIGTNQMDVSQWPSLTNLSPSQQYRNSDSCIVVSDLEWWRIQDDGTNRKYYWSLDGTAWIQFYSEATATYISPSHAGFFGNSYTSNYTEDPSLISWKVTFP